VLLSFVLQPLLHITITTEKYYIFRHVFYVCVKYIPSYLVFIYRFFHIYIPFFVKHPLDVVFESLCLRPAILSWRLCFSSLNVVEYSCVISLAHITKIHINVHTRISCCLTRNVYDLNLLTSAPFLCREGSTASLSTQFFGK